MISLKENSFYSQKVWYNVGSDKVNFVFWILADKPLFLAKTVTTITANIPAIKTKASKRLHVQDQQ